MKQLKNITFVLLLLTQLKSHAQFTWAQIGVDGLTCSACTRSVEMSIRKLAFVDSVSMNLEHTEGKIIFKKGVKVDIDRIAKAVKDAGFSLRSLYAGLNMAPLKISNDLCWTYAGDTYHFVKVAADADLKGSVSLRFVGEQFMSKKEFKNWKALCMNPCAVNVPKSDTPSMTYYVVLQ